MRAPRRSDFLDKALEIDPDYPLALSLAAWCHGAAPVYNWASDTEEGRTAGA